MNPYLRFFLAVLAGVFAGGAVVALVEALSHFFFPPPEAIDMDNACDYIREAPKMVFVFLLLAWAAGAMVAGVIAKLAYRGNNKPAFVAGAVFLIFVLFNLFNIPCHPLWVEILGALLPVPMAMIGSRFLATN